MKGWEDEVKCNFAALLISTGCRRGEGRELLNLKSCIPRLAVDSYIKLRGEGGGGDLPLTKASFHYLNPLFNFDGVSPLYSSG